MLCFHGEFCTVEGVSLVVQGREAYLSLTPFNKAVSFFLSSFPFPAVVSSAVSLRFAPAAFGSTVPPAAFILDCGTDARVFGIVPFALFNLA